MRRVRWLIGSSISRELFLTVLFLLSTHWIQAAVITSAGDGNWNDPATWTGGSVPGTTDDVVIQSDHVITVTDDRTCANLTIHCNSNIDVTLLTINASNTLTVTGNITLNSVTSGTLQIRVMGTLTVNGDITFNTPEANSATLKMNYQNGRINLGGNIYFNSAGRITADAANNSIFNFNGSNDQTIPVNTNIVYHTLMINNTGVNGASLGAALKGANLLGRLVVESGRFSNGGYEISGLYDSLFVIKSGATYVLEDTTKLPTGYLHFFETGSTIEYAGGRQYIYRPNNNQNYHHLVISGTNSKIVEDTLTIKGDVTINNGATLDLNFIENNNIYVEGNWTNNGTFLSRQAKVTFQGTSEQQITAGNSSFYKILVYNVSPTGIRLNGNLTVTNRCLFKDGVVITGNDTLIVTNSNASSVAGFSKNSFVYGNLRRYIATNTQTYAFPVGNGYTSVNYYLAAVINNNLTGVNYITAKFSALTNHNDADIVAHDAWLDYYSVNPAGVWILEPDRQPNGGSYNIKAYIENMSGLVDNQFGILKRPVNSTTAADWTDGGGALSPENGDGRLVSNGYALRKNLTSFSQFGAGSGSGGSLPIELLDFSAQPVEEGVLLKWSTATEIDNDYFTVERSMDGITFETVTIVDGAGNSVETLHYTAIDHKPYTGTSYYRLKQTDFNGKFSYSRIVIITYPATSQLQANITAQVYPNPLPMHTPLHIRVLNDDPKPEELTIDFYDVATGKKVYSLSINEATNIVNLPDRLTPGLYLLKGFSDSKTFNHKLVIQ